MNHISLNMPFVTGKEISYIKKAIESKQIGGDNTYTQLCSEFINNKLGSAKVLLTPSCTHALELSALLLNIEPGDEVILPSYTFTSTANAFILRGAVPVFADIHPDTLNIDERNILSLITVNTKAIVPVHYGGVSCNMNSICEIADSYNIPIIEDNAHGLFGLYNNKYLGTFGKFSTLSFHYTKNISSGEGGALIINDESYIERAEIIRDKGTNRKQFFQGKVDKYTWVDIGSSYLMSDILAAFLWAQLEEFDYISNSRKRVWDYYYSHLSIWAKRTGSELPIIPDNCNQTYHLFYILLPSKEYRINFLSYLNNSGISASFHYQPLHLSSMGRNYGYNLGDLPVTENISDRLVRLPIYPDLKNEDLDHIIKIIESYKI